MSLGALRDVSVLGERGEEENNIFPPICRPPRARPPRVLKLLCVISWEGEVREMDVVVLQEEEAEESTGSAEEPTEAPEHGTVHGRMPEEEAAAEEPTEAPELAASRGSFDSPGSPISQASGLADGVLHVHVE
jgi:hypothetical protein